MENGFFTFSEYLRKEHDLLTPSAEDYLEMIYRLSRETGFTRVNDLAHALNVQPPSVTKMLQRLAELNLINYERYGSIVLKPNGERIGQALLRRHNIIEQFLVLLNIKSGLLEQTEKIEHTINDEVLTGINDLLNFFKNSPTLLERFRMFRNGGEDEFS